MPLAKFSLLRVLALATTMTTACGPGTSTTDNVSDGEVGSVSGTSTSAETTRVTTGEAEIEGWPELWLGYYYLDILPLDVVSEPPLFTHLDNVELRMDEIAWEHISCRLTVTEQRVSVSYEKNRVEFRMAVPLGTPEEVNIVLRPPEDGDCGKLLMVRTFDGETRPGETLIRGRQYVFDTCDDDDTDWGPSLNSDVPTTCEL